MLSVKVEDGKIAQIQAQPENEQALLGNIYVGKVRNIVKNINAAFVEYELGKMAYLSLEYVRYIRMVLCQMGQGCLSVTR